MKQAILQIHDLSAIRSATFKLIVPNFSFKAGSVTCVAGPNGSGKSTLLACMAGLLQPDTGKITLDGQTIGNHLRATKAVLGYIPDDEAWFVGELTANEYFGLLAEVCRQAGVTHDTIARAKVLASKLQFTTFNQQLQQLSHGNKKKVQLIAGLMHQPKVIIIDELRNGLDPLAIIAAEQLIKDEAKRGACIVAATHDVWWAERIATTILLLLNGRIAVADTPRAIIRKHGSVENLFIKTVRAA
ncbi:MAG TPA: ABC transporter ATP-binding protein [Candidatus Saccharimonadales bacterium]|nr:ABC transporter ATP-binding protein [Candidatus Saccharimonadales bacterium]